MLDPLQYFIGEKANQKARIQGNNNTLTMNTVSTQSYKVSSIKKPKNNTNTEDATFSRPKEMDTKSSATLLRRKKIVVSDRISFITTKVKAAGEEIVVRFTYDLSKKVIIRQTSIVGYDWKSTIGEEIAQGIINCTRLK